ncbi:MAG: hypothetical protein ACTSRK_09845 [Promethearchaeota archaeon]
MRSLIIDTVEILGTFGTDTVRKFRFQMIPQMIFDLFPIPLIGTNFLACITNALYLCFHSQIIDLPRPISIKFLLEKFSARLIYSLQHD